MGNCPSCQKGGICRFGKLCTVEFNFDPQQTLTCIIKELDCNPLRKEVVISRRQHKPCRTNLVTLSSFHIFSFWKDNPNSQDCPRGSESFNEALDKIFHKMNGLGWNELQLGEGLAGKTTLSRKH